jgi:hypothetical protein
MRQDHNRHGEPDQKLSKQFSEKVLDSRIAGMYEEVGSS